jgi:hypothetical protein
MDRDRLMSKTPVLLLISRAIDLNVLNHSPRFQSYHFFSLTAMDYLENDLFRHKVQTLRNALHRNIERVGAQYLLVHLGLAFDRYPVEFLTAVLDVHVRHPGLKIRLDKGLMYALQYLRLSAASDPEATRLAVRLAQHRSAFDRDEDTDALSSCLY